MKATEIVAKAVYVGIDSDVAMDMTTAQLITAIQAAEGNTPCFSSRASGCPYTDCCWMADCYAQAKRSAAAPGPQDRRTVRVR